jgi:hypothetical protein
MTASLKAMLAGLAAVAISGAALAQGNPPNAAVTDPAVGAGQQSSKTTPMGTTGTPGSTAATTTTPSSTDTTASTTSGGTTLGATGTSDTAAASGSTTTTKQARADRN